jgi:hypothetical protein
VDLGSPTRSALPQPSYDDRAETIATQLRRRREASRRLPPLQSGHRDPLDELAGLGAGDEPIWYRHDPRVQVRETSLRIGYRTALRDAWRALKGTGLLTAEIEAELYRLAVERERQGVA